MTRFESDRYYRTTDPELEILGTRGTLAQWRHRGEGPSYIRFGNRVLYRGADLNDWLDSHVVLAVSSRGTERAARPGAGS